MEATILSSMSTGRHLFVARDDAIAHARSHAARAIPGAVAD